MTPEWAPDISGNLTAFVKGMQDFVDGDLRAKLLNVTRYTYLVASTHTTNVVRCLASTN